LLIIYSKLKLPGFVDYILNDVLCNYRDLLIIYSMMYYVVAHCNLGIEEVFSTSFSSWHDTWLLDTGAICHMTIRKEFFETSDQINGLVYFADKSTFRNWINKT
jgi:hypothetical protein